MHVYYTMIKSSQKFWVVYVCYRFIFEQCAGMPRGYLRDPSETVLSTLISLIAVKNINLMPFRNFSIVDHVDPILVTTHHDAIDLQIRDLNLI